MTEPTKTCSACGLPKPLTKFHRDANTASGRRSQCKLCYNASQARRYARDRKEILGRRAVVRAAGILDDNARAVTLRHCPVDRALGVPMYPAPCLFTRMHFQETLAEGYWPDGAVFDYAFQFRGERSRWRVSGRYLLEVDGERTAMASFSASEHACVRLVEAATAAKGE